MDRRHARLAGGRDDDSVQLHCMAVRVCTDLHNACCRICRCVHHVYRAQSGVPLWKGVAGCGRVWQGVAGCGRVSQGIAGCGRVLSHHLLVVPHCRTVVGLALSLWPLSQGQAGCGAALSYRHIVASHCRSACMMTPQCRTIALPHYHRAVTVPGPRAISATLSQG